MGLVHVTIVTQATIMIDAAHQTCTQRRVGEHRVSVGCTAPPTAWPAYARPSIRKLPIREIERLEPASPRSCEPGREPRRKSCEQHNSNCSSSLPSTSPRLMSGIGIASSYSSLLTPAEEYLGYPSYGEHIGSNSFDLCDAGDATLLAHPHGAGTWAERDAHAGALAAAAAAEAEEAEAEEKKNDEKEKARVRDRATPR